MNIIILALFISLETFGVTGWSPSSLTHLGQLSAAHKDLSGGPLMTSWGLFKRARQSSTHRGKNFFVTSREAKSGKAKLYLFKAQRRHRPLVIFFPDVLGEEGQPDTDQIISAFEKLDVNLLVVPNIVSKTFSRPKGDRAPIKAEVFLYQEIIQETLKESGSYFSRISVVGAGTGGFMASAWLASLDDGVRPQELILLWPSVNLAASIKNFDLELKEAEENWKACGALKTYAYFLQHFMLKDYPEGASEEAEACLSGWGLLKYYKKPLLQLKASSLAHFFRNYHPDFEKYLTDPNPELELTHWLTALHNKGFPAIKILTSFNDFQNKGLPMQEVIRHSKLPKGVLEMLDWGGHLGPMGEESFYDLISAELLPKTQSSL